MSKYAEQKTAFKDLDCLLETLRTMFSEVQYNAIAQRLEGFHGDKRQEIAEIIIPRRVVGGMSNDIGFKRNQDGTFGAIVSEYDSTRYGSDWMRKLKNGYTERYYLKQAKKAGLKPAGRKIVNGKLKLQFVKA